MVLRVEIGVDVCCLQMALVQDGCGGDEIAVVNLHRSKGVVHGDDGGLCEQKE